jgi:hypothetical protein
VAFSYYRSVTLDHLKAGASNSTNYPVTFTGTYSYLATVANGGLVQNANGYDIGFYSDSALTTKLDWEMVTYTATTGFLEAHFRVGTLSATTDGVVYLAYGDSGISTFQGNVTGTWNTGFDAVYHGGDGTTISLVDSTANAYSGTNNGLTASAGLVGGAMSGNASTTYANLANVSALSSAKPFSISMQLKSSNLGRYSALWGGDNASGAFIYLRQTNAGKINLVKSSVVSIGTSTTALSSTSAWYHVGVTYDSSGNYVFYFNGAADGTGTNNQTFTTCTARLGIESTADSLGGAIDEVRKSNVVRGGDWFVADYNNQSSPSTFYTMGSQTAVGGGAVASSYYSGYYYKRVIMELGA